MYCRVLLVSIYNNRTAVLLCVRVHTVLYQVLTRYFSSSGRTTTAAAAIAATTAGHSTSSSSNNSRKQQLISYEPSVCTSITPTHQRQQQTACNSSSIPCGRYSAAYVQQVHARGCHRQWKQNQAGQYQPKHAESITTATEQQAPAGLAV